MINVGVFGLGTVGQGVVQLLQENRSILEKRIGKQIRISKAVVANPDKKRGVDLEGIEISSDPQFILQDNSIDVVVELMGGLDNAGEVVLASLKSNKTVITANKALLAERASEIFPAVYNSTGNLLFESSVAGGIPIIRTVKEGLAGDDILEISGIINGTANYILSRMTDEGIAFEDVLKQAQDLGYAEADPSFDVDGNDTAHKIYILMCMAFNGIFPYEDLFMEGIRGIQTADIDYARELGYRIKLLGKAKKTEHGFEGRVHPCLVEEKEMLASVNGAFNAVSLTGNFVGPTVFYGQGAGAHPTASAVVSDLIEAARSISNNADNRVFPLGVSAEHLKQYKLLPMDDVVTEYYLRFTVYDEPGVLATISGILGDQNISIRSVIQKTKAHAPDEPVTLVILTHSAREKDIKDSLGKIDKLSFVYESTRLIRIDSQ